MTQFQDNIQSDNHYINLFKNPSGILHGGDYNPEQWLDRPDILEQDIVLMKEAGMNSATLGVFSWSSLEPVENEFHFDWLISIMDKLYENGIYTILATPTGGKPAWLDQTYPEALRVDSYGIRAHHGGRHNHCMTSPAFRSKAENLIRKLFASVGNHPGLIAWHISNEFGGECFCSLCQKRFQDYLSNKFNHDINALNHAWWTRFWSHTYNDFSQIEPPLQNGEYSIMGLNLEWKRFTTWNMNDYLSFEAGLLRSLENQGDDMQDSQDAFPAHPITTNFMQLYEGLDYRVLAKELDVISWDSYPVFHNDQETLYDTMIRNDFDHSVMRSMKPDRPFMLMESAPGLVNWQLYNKMKRPGIHELFSLQAIASGSDTVQYFQWRKGRGSYEQYHGAVVDHLGTNDTRIFKEVSQLGQTLKNLSSICSSIAKPKCAVLFEWDCMWSIQDMKALSNETKNYPKTVVDFYTALRELGHDVAVISTESDLSDYQVIITPMLYMLKDQIAQKLTDFVHKGGQLLATYLTGYVDENQLCYLGGFPGEGLKDVFGVISEEMDTLYASDKNTIHMNNGQNLTVFDYAELLRVSDAEVLGTYQSDYLKDHAAVTHKKYGDGDAYYVGARCAAGELSFLLKEMCDHAGLSGLTLPKDVTVSRRCNDTNTFTFYQNCGSDEVTLSDITGLSLLDGNVYLNEDVRLAPLKTIILKTEV